MDRSTAARRELWVAHLGLVPYDEGVALQSAARERRQSRELPDALLLLEHPPVYTKGRRTGPADLPMGEEWYEGQGIEVRHTDRGGRVTYHGPGQLVGYPIMAITDVIDYVRTMESALIAALADEGIEARVRMTSVCHETGRPGAMDCFRKRVAWRFAEAFGLRQRIVSPPRVTADRSAAPTAAAPAAERAPVVA